MLKRLESIRELFVFGPLKGVNRIEGAHNASAIAWAINQIESTEGVRKERESLARRVSSLEQALKVADKRNEELGKELYSFFTMLSEEHAKVGCGWGKEPVGDYCPVCDTLVDYLGG